MTCSTAPDQSSPRADQDKYLANYGLKVNPAPAVVKARLLPNPKVHFAGTGPNDRR